MAHSIKNINHAQQIMPNQIRTISKNKKITLGSQIEKMSRSNKRQIKISET